MSTSTALEIVYAAYDKKFSQNGDCDGLWISDTTYVNMVDMRIDMDYLQGYLLEVCDVDRDATEHYFHNGIQPSETGETWVSYLAVFQRHAGLGEVTSEWYDGDQFLDHVEVNGRRKQSSSIRFFSTERCTYGQRVRHWFVDWVEGECEAYAEDMRRRRGPQSL